MAPTILPIRGQATGIDVTWSDENLHTAIRPWGGVRSVRAYQGTCTPVDTNNGTFVCLAYTVYTEYTVTVCRGHGGSHCSLMLVGISMVGTWGGKSDL